MFVEVEFNGATDGAAKSKESSQSDKNDRGVGVHESRKLA